MEKKIKQQSRELKQIMKHKMMFKTLLKMYSVLSELFINIKDMIESNSYISASGGLFSDRTNNLLRRIEKRMK